jgi:hypothetical protein
MPIWIRSSQVNPALGVDDLPAQAGLEHERLDPPLKLQPAQDEAGDDGDDQARADVHQGGADAEEPEQQGDGDLVDQGARNQEAQGDPERDPGRDETDERRNGTAGADQTYERRSRRKSFAPRERKRRRQLYHFGPHLPCWRGRCRSRPTTAAELP